MRREHALLCQLMRRDTPRATLIDAVAAHPPLEWDALLNAAESHCVIEQLCAPLSALRPHVPQHVLGLLEARLLQLTICNLRLTSQLTELLDLLRANGIRALAFKGPTMAAAIYGHIGLRSSVDLDVLVERRTARRVRPLLMRHGYTLPPRRRKRGGSLLHGLLPAAGREDALLPPHDAVAGVDVHVAFAFWTQGIRLATRQLFARATVVDVAGARVATLSPGDLLLVLSIHGMMHGWSVLRLIRDIDAVADHVREWDAVVARARAARMLRVLHVALLLAHGVMGSRIPPGVLARAAFDARAVAIAESVPPRLFNPPAVWDPRPWFLAFQDDARGRLRFEARTLIYEWFLKWPWDEWLGRRRLPRESL